ncbi:AraC family transcriptional regulator ligand-binding domain-containing protein [Palleronia abyssalis]|uniref:AraC family transcriptional regulator ligand-binding domain-containing protein n=1 Tax=Palleronia abyssalis TaxID=1501240 RepID=UPI002481DD72|nr:AraC family transcriptional regulator ligand-binding domain-containing protein [Palleronia abyssalis]
MGYVTSFFARKMVAAASDGIDTAGMLSPIGIDPEGPRNPSQMIPAARYCDMLERMAGQIDVTGIPVRTGASMRLDEYGALGPAFKAATTLRASYARIERNARLWTSVVRYELRPARGGYAFHHAPRRGQAAGDAAVERGDPRQRRVGRTGSQPRAGHTK